MNTYDICFDCDKLTKISKHTLGVMKKLDLLSSDFKIRCDECKARDIHRLANLNYIKDKDYD